MSEEKQRGRPPINNKAMERFNVVLDEDARDYLRGLGNGNLSAGIRLAALYSAAYQVEKSNQQGPTDR